MATQTRRKTRRMAAFEGENSEPFLALTPKGKKAKIVEEEQEPPFSPTIGSSPENDLLCLVVEGVKEALGGDDIESENEETESDESEEESEEESKEESKEDEEGSEAESEEETWEETRQKQKEQEKKEKKKWSLDPGLSLKDDLYFSSGRKETDAGRFSQVEKNNTALNSVLEKKSEFYSVEARNIGQKDPTKYAVKKMRAAEKKKTAGKKWFDLPATKVDLETKRDLQILRMRGSIYKDRFFKGDRKELPKYFQVGRVVSGAAEHYNKINRKERKQNFVEEILGDSQMKKYAKRKFLEVQYEKSRGGQATSRPKKRRKVGRK